MRKEEFISRLQLLLADIERDEIEQVVEYYQELLYDGMEQGYSEEQIIKGFGTPEEAADRVREEYGGLVVYGSSPDNSEFQASDMVHTVLVEAANVRIRVRSVDKGHVRVLFKPKEGSDQVSYTEENGVFSFIHKVKGFLHLNWLNLFMDFNVLIVEVPKSFSGLLKIKTSNASISGANLTQLTKGEFTSSNGKIRLENIRAEEVSMQTQNGSVIGRNLISDKIFMETCNGNVTGTIIGNKNDYRIESKTVNGSNNLAQESAAQNRSKSLTARTTNGRIDVTFIQ